MPNKKGIAHLLATVLLVALTVTFAAIVMTWGRGFLKTTQGTIGEKAQKNIGCEFDIKLDIKDINLTNNTLILQLENAGSGDIDRFSIRIYGSNETEEVETTDGLESLGIQTFGITFNVDKVGTVDKIGVTPKLKTNDQVYIPCSNKQIIYKMV